MGFSFNNHKILGSILVVSREVLVFCKLKRYLTVRYRLINTLLMPKEVQGLTSVKKKYCPRSLLNSDSALFKMILAEGMKMVLQVFRWNLDDFHKPTCLRWKVEY